MDPMLSKELRRIRALRTQFENFLLEDVDGSREREARKFLTKRPCWVANPAQAPVVKRRSTLLKLLGTVALLATTVSFVARYKFVVDTSPSAVVKISYIGDNFKAWFLSGDGKIEAPMGEVESNYYHLQRDATDLAQGKKQVIIPELGGEDVAETTLTELWDDLGKHARGEVHGLLTNGYANIRYIRDQNGVLRTVLVTWRGLGWDVGAIAVGSPSPWSAGSRVFSRKSA
jgi:hypothetical protein